jgi:hypothetical protein
MKKLKTFEEYRGTPEEIFGNKGTHHAAPGIAITVDEYCEKYPAFANFFKEFVEVLPDISFFDEKLYDYFDEPEEDDDFDNMWHPEAEVALLQSEFNIDFDKLTSDVWVDFFNDLCYAGWDKINTNNG